MCVCVPVCACACVCLCLCSCFFYVARCIQSKRKAISAGLTPAKKAPVAPMVTVKKPPTLTISEKAAAQGVSGVTSHYVSAITLCDYLCVFLLMTFLVLPVLCFLTRHYVSAIALCYSLFVSLYATFLCFLTYRYLYSCSSLQGSVARFRGKQRVSSTKGLGCHHTLSRSESS